PLRERLDAVLHVVPLGVPETASALVTLAGLGLVLLAWGIRRGQRHAWTVSVGLLAWTVVLHIVKGADLEEAGLAAMVAAFLVRNRASFRAATDRPSQRRAVLAVAFGGLGVVGLATGVVEVVTATRGRGGRIALGRAAESVTERMIGIRHVGLPHRLDLFVTPSMEALAAGLAAIVAWLALRPVVARRHADADTGLAKAREIVAGYGQGTLDFFALRTDKRYFFNGSSLVAYAVYGGVCLVSPDPIGPESERDQVWKAFREFADSHGWTLAVLGASEDWLPTYRASGMHDLYVGDEGVVDVGRFSLEGGKHKGLRQAVNRIAKYGYTISFHDPCAMAAPAREQLRAVMTKSRQGEVERGFSMTLGRVFDPEDRGLLLAVAHDPSGEAVAFCQYVPANGIDGYSLDLMRRDEGPHPNGLIDFVVVRTIEHLRALGKRGLGLNFATMRAVLAGEAGDSLTQRVERWLLKRMSGSMQIESLWRFNAKYDPAWQPRYAVYDSPEHMVTVAMAIARAESFWELPLIGR
ncbi:MAG TPA: phosphatidylglycerol lysyltransferase domain-containing protein, partial [Acidimicrobiales bacterium]